jgi:hypothetical protein
MPHNGLLLGLHRSVHGTIHIQPTRQNGTLGDTLADSATSMMHHANGPSKYLGLPMRAAVYPRNRIPSLVATSGSGGVPYVVLHGALADLSHP